MEKDYKDYSDLDCFLHFKKLRRNFEKKWNSAEIIAKEDSNSAISLHIISIEEQIKSLVMIFDSLGFQFRKMSNINILMDKSHVIRHFVGYILFGMNILVTEMFDLNAMARNRQKTQILIFNETIRSRFISYKFHKTIKKIKAAFAEFEKLEKTRLRGNHVDKNSSEISYEEYLIIYEKLSTAKATLDFIVDMCISLRGDEESNEVKNAKESFIKDGWYDSIDEKIKESYRSRNNPFKNAKEFFDEMKF